MSQELSYYLFYFALVIIGSVLCIIALFILGKTTFMYPKIWIHTITKLFDSERILNGREFFCSYVITIIYSMLFGFSLLVPFHVLFGNQISPQATNELLRILTIACFLFQLFVVYFISLQRFRSMNADDVERYTSLGVFIITPIAVLFFGLPSDYQVILSGLYLLYSTCFLAWLIFASEKTKKKVYIV